jgi:hypothetical protein
MRIAVLGPLEVRRDDSAPVAVPGADERLLLAALAARAPDAVSAETLLEILGDGGSRDDARAALQFRVHALRSSLDPGLGERSSGQYVLRRGQGYALAVSRSDVDVLHATDLVTRGRARLQAGDGSEAARLLTAALALWRGQPYADWPHGDFPDAERRRLAEVRAAAEAALAQARALPARYPPTTRPPVLRPAAAVRPSDGSEETPANRPAPEPAVVARVAAEADAPEADAPVADDPVDAVGGGPPRVRAGRWLAALAAALAAVLVATALSSRAHRADERAATVARADQLAVQAARETRLDVSLLLAAQAFRLADTSLTRELLRTALVEHGRVERVVGFTGIPQDPVLSGGGGTLTFGIGSSVERWVVGPRSEPDQLMAVPEDWVTWLVTAGSPTDEVLLAAGGAEGQPWVRAVSTVDGSARVLAGGDQIGGRPIDGVVTPDGQRFLLLAARPDPEAPDRATRWRLLDLDVANGAQRDTGLAGTLPVPAGELHADFADDAGSVVLWGSGGTAEATLVDIAAGRQTPIPSTRGPQSSAGFRAVPSGVAELWFDGMITLFDGNGAVVQWLDLHTSRVRDVVVSADRTWAATAGAGSEVVRWDVDPDSGRWSRPQPLAGHHGGVVGLEADGADQLFSVSVDSSVIVWDMRESDGPDAERSARPDDVAPSVWLHDACAVVGRDLDATEWRRYLPDLPIRPTCSDLG